MASIACLADRVKWSADISNLKGAGDHVALLGQEIDLAGAVILDRATTRGDEVPRQLPITWLSEHN